MNIELIRSLRGRKRNIWQNFLAKAGLEADQSVEQTALVWANDILVATGSRQENLLKCLAVDPAHQGEDLLATVLTALRREAFEDGHRHLFLYTKPINKHLFSGLLFHPVAQTEDVLLMEDKRNGIHDFLESLTPVKHSGMVGAAVMNCDPFTLGHQHLIETAAKTCDHVFVFVLSEDKGLFSAWDRIQMVKKGTMHLHNVTVLPTGPYLISSTTFPTYFLKKRDQVGTIHCQLDIEIFTRYFVPAFGIKCRFVGTEPLSALTSQYNEALKTYLPQAGISVTEIPRLKAGSMPISASAVRQAYKQQNWEVVKALVPATTYDYLQTLQQEASQ